MLSNNLENTLSNSISFAAKRRHEFATLEHLLLALCDDPDAVQVMQGCNVNLQVLKNKLVEFIDVNLGTL